MQSDGIFSPSYYFDERVMSRKLRYPRNPIEKKYILFTSLPNGPAVCFITFMGSNLIQNVERLLLTNVHFFELY